MPNEMPPHARSFRLAPVALGLALLPATLLPAGAQMRMYEGPYGAPYGAPSYGYEVPGQIPPRVPRYSMLPPREVMAIVRGMGYRQVSLPRLSGGFYVVTAIDEFGPAALRVNAVTGRVVSVRSIRGGPSIAAPDAPPPSRAAAPAPRPSAPPVARVSPPPAPASAPLPPPRPPEAAVAAVTPAPPPEPAAPAPATAPAAAPGNPGPAPQPAPAPGSPAQAGQAPLNPTAPAPANRKAGVGTGGGASAGTASVLSRPKPSN